MIKKFSFFISVAAAANAVSAFSFFASSSSQQESIVPGENLTTAAVNIYAASYLAPFALEDAEEKPYDLIDDHEDLVQDRHGSIVSLRKRGDDCQKYHKGTSAQKLNKPCPDDYLYQLTIFNSCSW